MEYKYELADFMVWQLIDYITYLKIIRHVDNNGVVRCNNVKDLCTNCRNTNMETPIVMSDSKFEITITDEVIDVMDIGIYVKYVANILSKVSEINLRLEICEFNENTSGAIYTDTKSNTPCEFLVYITEKALRDRELVCNKV